MPASQNPAAQGTAVVVEFHFPSSAKTNQPN
jgi:hypothetical protein